VQTVRHDTATHPLMRRGDYWLDEVCAQQLGVFGRTYAHADPFFFGQMDRSDAFGMVTTQVTCTAGIAYRRAEHIRRWTHDAAVVVLQRGRGATWQQGAQALKLGQGDLLVANPDEPYALASDGDFDFVSFYVPRSVLAENFLPGSPDTARVISASRPAGALAAGFAHDLAARLETLDAASAAAMTAAMVRVLAVAAGAEAAAHQPTLREAKLAQALRYMEKHLADPELTPASCARALGVSLRGLHLLFEPTGESFLATLVRKRLLRCRALLDRPEAARHSVTDIALGCGFGSMAGFYRAFQREFGGTPRELRG